MDEIEEKKKVKRIYIKIGIMFIVPIILNAKFLIDAIKKNSDISIKTGILLTIMSVIPMVIYISLWIYYLITNGKKIEINDKEYIRYLNDCYPPAIAGLIEDMKIFSYKDYTATFLNLYVKKYIDVKNSRNGGINILEGSNTALDNLYEHERYVYNCIIGEEIYDANIFKNYILEDSERQGLIERKKSKYVDKYLDVNNLDWKTTTVISVVGCIVGGLGLAAALKAGISMEMFGNIIYSVAMVVVMPIILIYEIIRKINNNSVKLNYKKTIKGKEESRKIKGIKNYIRDYTLIKDKDIRYIEILENYIPYAISLELTPKIEAFIKENEIYRAIIYNKDYI